MRHRTSLRTWFLTLLVLGLLYWLWTVTVAGQEQRICPDADRLTCLERSVLAAHNMNTTQSVDIARRDAQIATLDAVVTSLARDNKALLARLAAVEARPGGLTRADVEAVAWEKATDRLGLFKAQSITYEDRFLYDVVYQRWLRHACANAVPLRVSCP